MMERLRVSHRNSEAYLCRFLQWRSRAWHRGSILASHPAALGSNPSSAEIFLSENFSLYCLVCEQYWDPMAPSSTRWGPCCRHSSARSERQWKGPTNIKINLRSTENQTRNHWVRGKNATSVLCGVGVEGPKPELLGQVRRSLSENLLLLFFSQLQHLLTELRLVVVTFA